MSKQNNQYLENRTILIVEDQPDTQLLIQKIVKGAGGKVLLASNGKQAIELALEEIKIDVVLMDINIPVLDGFQVAETVKSKGFNSPLIAVTGSTKIDDKLRSQKIGFVDYVCKPIIPDDLVALLIYHSK